MKKTLLRLAGSASIACAAIASPGASAQTTVLSDTFSGANSLPGGPFTGSFTLTGTPGAYTLTAFSGVQNGYSYNLSNVAFINHYGGSPDDLFYGTLNTTAVGGGTNDFYFSFNDATNTGSSGVISETGSGFAPLTVAVTLVSLTTIPAAAPEPGAWAMMIAGFGLAGYALRRRAVAVMRPAGAGGR